MAKKGFTTEEFIQYGKIGNATTDSLVITDGFYEYGDGGGATWKHNGVTGQTPSQTPAQLGDSLFNDSNGDQWELVGLYIKIEMLGVGVDDTNILKAAFATKDAIIDINGDHFVSDSIVMESGVCIKGAGRIIAVGNPPATTEAHFGLLLATEKTDISISGITIDISDWTSLPPGASSLRCITFRRCAYYDVERVKFRSTGGAVASIGCKHFSIVKNEIATKSPENLADGIIDTWCEFDIDSEDFLIECNVINSSGASRWGVLVNGVAFESQVMECRDFVIRNNKISNTGLDGIWVGGRMPTAHDFMIYDNNIDGARKGISISDCKDAHIFSNNIKNTVSTGIELWRESGAGGSTSALNCHVYDNELFNVASQAGQPTAIWITDESTGNVIHSNKVRGSTHYYGLLFGPNAGGNVASQNTIEKGRDTLKIRQFGLLNRLDDGVYTPLLTIVSNLSAATSNVTQYSVSSERCVVNFKINVTSIATGQFDVTMSIPINSSFTSVVDAIGNASTSPGNHAIVEADISSGTVKISGHTDFVGSFGIFGSLSYLIK